MLGSRGWVPCQESSCHVERVKSSCPHSRLHDRLIRPREESTRTPCARPHPASNRLPNLLTKASTSLPPQPRFLPCDVTRCRSPSTTPNLQESPSSPYLSFSISLSTLPLRLGPVSRPPSRQDRWRIWSLGGTSLALPRAWPRPSSLSFDVFCQCCGTLAYDGKSKANSPSASNDLTSARRSSPSSTFSSFALSKVRWEPFKSPCRMSRRKRSTVSS